MCSSDLFAASAELQASLTRRALSRSVLFATPREAEGSRKNDWARAAAAADTVALYMAVGEAVAVRDALLAQGVPESRPVVIVENAASAQVRVMVASVGTLPGVADRVGDGPALVLIGEVYADLATAQNAAREFFSAQRAELA